MDRPTIEELLRRVLILELEVARLQEYVRMEPASDAEIARAVAELDEPEALRDVA